MYKPGTIVLVNFPFTDLQSSKVRPALVLTTKGDDVIILGIFSKVPDKVHESWIRIDEVSPDFHVTGLKKHGLSFWKICLWNPRVMTPDYVRAHKKSMGNRDEVLASERCGCFYCLQIFLPVEVNEWTDEKEGVGQTALCPRCGIDAVIGSESGYPITADFLRLMKEHWFAH